MERFHRLDIPLNQGPVDLEDAPGEAEETLKEGGPSRGWVHDPGTFEGAADTTTF